MMVGGGVCCHFKVMNLLAQPLLNSCPTVGRTKSMNRDEAFNRDAMSGTDNTILSPVLLENLHANWSQISIYEATVTQFSLLFLKLVAPNKKVEN